MGGDMAANIDESEILKFERQTPAWWKKKGEFKGLHDINPLRVRYIDDRTPLRGRRVLDVGCGGGILAESLAALGAKVTGIDAGKGPLEVARNHARLSGLQIEYRQTTAEQLAELQSDVYDVVTCMELLEHVPQPASIVGACQRLVKPDGDVFFATLNRTFLSWLLAIVAAEYVLGIVKRGTHDLGKFIKPAEIDGWAGKTGLVRQDVTGLHYNPILKRKWLGGHTLVNYLMHFKKPATA
jgi:2-polyprenyl-6-hydroxyphenyl methylase/3-demethylubiquinone-9 3-methyltransferase